MLVDLATLFTSAAMGPIAEAFVVHENNYSIVATSLLDGPESPAAAVPAVDAPIAGAETPAGTRAVSLSELSTLTGVPLLSELALLSGNTLDTFVRANPETVANLLASPPSASTVSGWWATLEPAAVSTLMASAPQVLGNLDGIPSYVRNFANRTWVAETMVSLEQGIAAGPGRAVQQESERQLLMLAAVQSTLGTGDSLPLRSLLSVDVAGQGTASVVLGDLATADYVTFIVPGMFFTVEGQVGDWTDDAARLYDEQVSWLNLINEKDSTVAVVAWMGYQTPNLTNIGTLDLAYEGRDALARAVEGLQTERAGNLPYTTIAAHSYGSTAALMALTDYDFEVDALALLGSPGSSAQSVDELHVRDGNVFAGEAAWDPVPNSSFFGSDPGSPSYGAKPMSVTGGTDLITNEVLAASIGHNGYFAPGTEAVRNMALIGIGHGELVTDGTEHDSERTLATLQW